MRGSRAGMRPCGALGITRPTSGIAADDDHVAVGRGAGVDEAVEAAGVEDDAFAGLEAEGFVADRERGFAGEEVDGLGAVVLMGRVRGLASGDFGDVEMQRFAAVCVVDGATG